MVGESFAIIALLAVLDTAMLRAGRKVHALITLPLVSVPVFYLLGWLLSPAEGVRMALDILGLAAGIGIAVFLAFRVFQSARTRAVYLAVVSGFNLALTVAYVINI